MRSGLNIRQVIGHKLIRGGQLLLGCPGAVHDLKFDNRFTAGLYRRGRLIKTFQGHNDVTVVGKNHLLDVTFGNTSPVTQIDPWYIGLINNTPAPVLSENDTLASHSGWSELTAYSGNRKAWVDANAASKIKGTTTVATFTFNASGTAYGILIAGVDTGTGSVLWATGAFDEVVDFVISDELKVSYGIRT